MRSTWAAVAVSILLPPGLSAPLHAQPAPAATANACFSADALHAKPGEQTPLKGIHTFDKPEAARDLQPFSPVPPHLKGAIRRVKLKDPAQKLVALTFDLCEQPGEIAGYDGAIFDILRARGIKATLFTGGKWLRSHTGRAEQLLTDPLFEIGNHSEAHRNLRLLDGARLTEEIAGPQRAYEAIASRVSEQQCVREGAGSGQKSIPARMSLFRFPYGACSAASLDAVNAAGLLAIQWDVSVGDPTPAQSAKAITAALIHGAKPGSILIAHANGRGYHTAEALPAALDALTAKGFRFVTVSELLAAGEPEIADRCYNVHPGDTDQYDHPGILAKKESKKASGWSTTIGR